MRCLYIASHWPLSPNHRGGAAAIYYEQLASLYELGFEIHLWHFSNEKNRAQFDQFQASDPESWEKVKGMCQSNTLTTLPQRLNFRQQLRDKWTTLINGHPSIWPQMNPKARKIFKELLHRIQPDIIFAQHLWAGNMATLQKQIPVVYSHHDWLYQIKALRGHQTAYQEMQSAEERVARDADVIISGSIVECDQLRQLGCRRVAYIPIAYEAYDLDFKTKPLDLRLFHLGGMATTATRVGLERFFERVWPQLADGERPPFYVVGDISMAPPELKKQLAQVICPGFVSDLRSIFRPFDLHLIPWEHSTGQRTRLPLAFNFGQVVVAVRAAIAGFPEAIDGVNCRIVDEIDEMGEVISELTADTQQRFRLGRAARETFEASFTRSALLPRYRQALQPLNLPINLSTGQPTNLEIPES